MSFLILFISKKKKKDFTLDVVAVLVLVQVVVDRVEIGAVRAVHVEPPIAHAHGLIEHGAVGAQEAEQLSGGQTPVPNLQKF